MKHKILKTERIYRGKIFNVLRSKIGFNRPRPVSRTSPSTGLRVNWWEMVEHNGAATILPVLPDQRVILVWQYRYPIRK
ncbi:MAG: hypothetical protein KAI63_04565, partial [Planctomycetes bacterium]|nr:hypothetical protein [Planctomycetota bacterium]